MSPTMPPWPISAPRTESISWSSVQRRRWSTAWRIRCARRASRCSVRRRQPPSSKAARGSPRTCASAPASRPPAMCAPRRLMRRRPRSTGSRRPMFSRPTDLPPARASSSPTIAPKPKPRCRRCSAEPSERRARKSCSRNSWRARKQATSPSPTGLSSCRSAVHRTTSVSATATPGRTPAAWALTAPRRS